MGPGGRKNFYKRFIAIHQLQKIFVRILKYSKIEHDIPARWDAIEMAENAGLLDPAKTSHVGEVMGAGFIRNYITKPSTGRSKNSQIQYYGHEQAPFAAREFEFMHDAAKNLLLQQILG